MVVLFLPKDESENKKLIDNNKLHQYFTFNQFFKTNNSTASVIRYIVFYFSAITKKSRAAEAKESK